MNILNKAKKTFLSTRFAKGVLLGVVIFIGLNLVVGVIYRNKTYPRTTLLNHQIGNMNISSVNSKIDSLNLLPESIRLQTDYKSADVQLSELGINLDKNITSENLKKTKSWLPVINLISPPKVDLSLKVDDAKFDVWSSKLLSNFRKSASDAQIVYKNGVFSIQSERTGTQLNKDNLKESILTNLDQGNTSVGLATQILNPKIVSSYLTEELKALQDQQQVSIVYRYQGKSVKPTPSDIGNWFTKKGNGYTVSTDLVKSYINKTGSSFGIQVQDIDSFTKTTVDNLTAQKSISVTLKAIPKRLILYTYCVASKGVGSNYIPDFKSKIYSTLNDSRGWSLGGQMQFSEAGSGCNFTIWLSAANLMPTFGSICDTTWSCTVSPNVIINFDRWTGASTAWNQSGGSLSDYRSMVINHEVGHWLGFNHRYCGGAGQLAPVMQQQSINLQGCKFNPWPLPSELASLKSVLGL